MKSQQKMNKNKSNWLWDGIEILKRWSNAMIYLVLIQTLHTPLKLIRPPNSSFIRTERMLLHQYLLLQVHQLQQLHRE